MLTLNISQQYGKIDITTTRASSEITTTHPQLNMETEPATVEIRQPKGELKIDWEPFRASYGIKTSSQFARDCAERGRQKAMEAIEGIVQDGNRMAQIETGEDVIVALATEANFPPAPEINLAYLEPPAIHYTAHKPEFNPTPGRVNFKFIPGRIDVNYQPATVNIRMAQYPSIKMWVTDNTVDISA